MVDQAFDPYYEWLGISPHERPINHYRLLELPLFVSDGDKIREAADAKMQRVRTFQSGKRASESQRLLNEISAAKTCLLDSDTKATYDAVLQGQLASATVSSRSPAKPQNAAPGVVAPPPIASPTATSPPAPPPVASTSSENSAEEFDDAPWYFQPWFLVLIVACVMLIGVGGWGITVLVASRTDITESPEVEASPADDASEQDPSPVEEPVVDGILVEADLDGIFHLVADDASLEGNPKLAARADGNVIMGITSPDDRVSWRLQVETPGAFRIEGTYSTSPAAAGGEYIFQTGESESKLLSTRNTGDPGAYTSERIGFIWFKRSGEYQLTLVPKNIPGGQSLMMLRSLRIVPVKGGSN